MKTVLKFLQKNHHYMVATIDENGHPINRPYSFTLEYNGKLYIANGDHKPSYRQMMNNPKVEICSITADHMKWLRIACNVELEENPDVYKKAFEVHPYLNKMYGSNGTAKLTIFALKNATATFYSFSGIEKEVKF